MGISDIPNVKCYQVLQDEISKEGKSHLSQAISRTWLPHSVQVRKLTSRGRDLILTGFESALFTNGAPIILSRSC